VSDEKTRATGKTAAKRSASTRVGASKGAAKDAAKAARTKAVAEAATPAEAKAETTSADKASAKPPRPSAARPEPAGLRLRYRDDAVPALLREFRYLNQMQVPRLEKVVVNIGLGEAIQNAKAIDAAVGDLATITGQKPIVTRATRSIAQFRLRTGMPVGAKVTLRGQRMYDFLERTMRLALPRIRDFRGVSPRSFDGRGNFTLGLREQLMYPEIDYDKIDRLRGLEISIVTTARTDEEGRRLLALLGMPFAAN
jgi:large subunit ribosomal protein L5